MDMEIRDYFISYSNEQRDAEWAEWVNGVLEGYATTYFQKRDVQGGMNFLDWMDESIKRSRGLIVIWSEHYDASYYCKLEREAALFRKRDDPAYHILMLRVTEAPIENLLWRGSAYVDLLSPYEDKNRKVLLNAVQNQMNRH